MNQSSVVSHLRARTPTWRLWRSTLAARGTPAGGARWLLLATLLYIGSAVFLTWPLVEHFNHSLYAANPPGDPIGSLSFYRDLVADHKTPFLPGVLHQVSAPAGQPIPWGRDLGSLPSVLTDWLFSLIFGAVAGANLYVFLAFVATGSAMFCFMRWLTGNMWVALLCGWMYAFYPFATINGQGHVDGIQGWVFVLALRRLVVLQREPNIRNAGLVALTSAFAMWWTPYFILLWGVALVVLALVTLVFAWRDGRLGTMLRLEAFGGAIVLVFFAAIAAVSTGSSGQSLGVRTNGLAEFNAYSARILEYLLPDANNPIFGHDTAGYLMAHIHGSNPSEATLYVGVTTLALGFIALVAAFARRLTGPLARIALMAACLALVAIIFSAPPQGSLDGVTIDFPAHFVMELTTTWRVYSRFVVVAMLGLTVLAGIGLDWLSRRRRRSVSWAILTVATVLVVLDLWARVPNEGQRVYTTVHPSVFTTLAHQRQPGLVAEYPLVPNEDSFYWDVYYQSLYRKPLINGYESGSLAEHRALSVANLALPTTAGRLAEMGVRYIVVEKGPSPYGLPPAGTPRTGFRRLASDWFATLYMVTARPSGPALPAVGPQFDGDEIGAGGVISNWLEEPTGTIALTGRCLGCRGVLSMTLTSFARPRTVTVSAGGRVLWRHRVVKPIVVRIPLTYGETRSLTLAATPGPQSIAATIGGTDDRSVSIYVTNLQYRF
jgi:hypothetical protein